LAVPLCTVFQESYESGQLPQDWKLANISAIFKKGSKQDAKNTDQHHSHQFLARLWNH